MNQKRIEYEIVLNLIRSKTHGRALAKELKLPLTTMQRAINKLYETNVLDFEESGKNKIYHIKNHLSAREYVCMAEHYKIIKLIQHYPFLEPILSELKKINSPLIMLFGSYAKFIPKKDSDIDIYLESRDMKTKEKAEEIYSRLNAKIGSFDKDDLLIKEKKKDEK